MGYGVNQVCTKKFRGRKAPEFIIEETGLGEQGIQTCSISRGRYKTAGQGGKNDLDNRLDCVPDLLNLFRVECHSSTN